MLLYTPTTAGDIAPAQERRAVELEAAAVARTEGDLDAAQTTPGPGRHGGPTSSRYSRGSW